MDAVDIRLVPRGGCDAIAGEREGAVLIAKALRVPRSSVRIVRGQASRDKAIAVEGMDAAAVRAALLASG